MKTGAERYSNKTEDYARYRPDFPPKIIRFLSDSCMIDNHSIIADIGSGTGRFTRLLLKKCNTVFGVEQNEAMRKKAEILLTNFSNFISVAGSAENTGLEDRSVDLITVAQAFHWFDKGKSLLEFKRIIREKGKVFIVWDDFVGSYNDFSVAYSQLLSTYSIVKPENAVKEPSRSEMISEFFKDNQYEEKSFTHVLYQNFEGIRGGALSASFTPNPDEDQYEPFIYDLKKVFDQYQIDGEVCTAFCSNCYLGDI